MVTSLNRGKNIRGTATPVDKFDYMLMIMDEMREACEVRGETLRERPVHAVTFYLCVCMCACVYILPVIREGQIRHLQLPSFLFFLDSTHVSI